MPTAAYKVTVKNWLNAYCSLQSYRNKLAKCLLQPTVTEKKQMKISKKMPFLRLVYIRILLRTHELLK